MQLDDNQPKLCWYCANIAKCNPKNRPQNECNKFEASGRHITQNIISSYLGMSLRNFQYIMYFYGADKIIEMLKGKGYIVRYIRGFNNIEFYIVDGVLEE